MPPAIVFRAPQYSPLIRICSPTPTSHVRLLVSARGPQSRAHRVRATADRGAPLVTEHALGDGTAVILGYEASLMCFEPGAAEAEARLVQHALGAHEPRFEADGGIVYRLAAPDTDHYFLINDGPATTITLQYEELSYQSATDLISGESVPVGGPYPIGPDTGRWLRFEK